jgi:N-acyl homoserine lactone hydrolase
MKTNPFPLVFLLSCAATSHSTQVSRLGTAVSSADIFAPGATVELESINAADWSVERGGLINLKHPTAQQAGLTEGDESIQIYFHAIRHPTKGLFIVDTGVEKALRDAPEKSAIGGLVRSAMHTDSMKVQVALSEWLADKVLAGVFLTHLHVDHITGMADVPSGTPVYTGPGEAQAQAFNNLFTKGTVDQTLTGKPALSEWNFAPDAGGAFEGVVDIFQDGSVYALWVPGHTPGSTAYLVRTALGFVLLTGDASHTRWGWDHDVEPGTFTGDGPRGVISFQKLRTFSKAHPEVEVRVGHQAHSQPESNQRQR